MATIKEFKKNFTKAIQEGYAGVFAGAGLSRASGFIDWKDLLRDLADEINLDVNKETDLVEVAQYYCNEKRGRYELNERILNRFVTDAEDNQSIQILSRMPISTYWTTNFDHLIEEVLKSVGKKVDIKIKPDSLAASLAQADATVYKMHGDYLDPATCVITKEDFELYNSKRQLFSTALQGDLVSKTFLFIGFSFDDPNLKYILSRIRNLLDENRRTHFCFFEKLKPEKYNQNSDYLYSLNKQELKIKDLKRYGIDAILLDNYNEIPSILADIERHVKTKNVFISGSAAEYGENWSTNAPEFIRKLTQALCRHKDKIVTGHALGVGSYIVSTAIEECQSNVTKLEHSLLIKAFPYQERERTDYKKIVYKYREGIFKNAGIAIFIFGNKQDGEKIDIAEGVYQEYEIAKQSNAYIIPVGSTGYVAKMIWEEINSEIEKYPYLLKDMDILGTCTDIDILVATIIGIVNLIQNTL